MGRKLTFDEKVELHKEFWAFVRGREAEFGFSCCNGPVTLKLYLECNHPKKVDQYADIWDMTARY